MVGYKVFSTYSDFVNCDTPQSSFTFSVCFCTPVLELAFDLLLLMERSGNDGGCWNLEPRLRKSCELRPALLGPRPLRTARAPCWGDESPRGAEAGTQVKLSQTSSFRVCGLCRSPRCGSPQEDQESLSARTSLSRHLQNHELNEWCLF